MDFWRDWKCFSDDENLMIGGIASEFLEEKSNCKQLGNVLQYIHLHLCHKKTDMKN